MRSPGEKTTTKKRSARAIEKHKERETERITHSHAHTQQQPFARIIIRRMAWTNFVITGAAIVAVASLMRSDIRTSTSMLRRNVKTIRKMMEDVSNGESIGEVVKKGEEEIAKKLKK